MNKFQLLNEVKQRLQDQAWTGSSVEVFNDDSVRIISGDEIEAFGESIIPPAAFIRPGAGQSDPLHGEEPDLIQFTFDVLLIASNSGDRVGEHPIMGANREALTDSRGRGLLELEEELFNAIERLTDETGVRIQSVASGSSQIAEDLSNNVVAVQEYSFEAIVTADRYYHAPIGVTATNLTGGDARIRWTDPPVRYDRVDIEIRSAAGPTAPADSSSGSLVARVALGVGSYVDSPGAGEISYAVFASYNDHGGTTRDRYSENEQGSFATVTVS